MNINPMKKKLKIALLSPFEESVPPGKYGGTELIVYHLAELLAKKGHEVFLLATGDSKTKAKLIPIFPKSIRKEPYCSNLKFRNALKYIGISKVIKELQKIDVDIIHNHIGWRFLPFASFLSAPTLTTLHGPLNIPYQQFVYGRFKKFRYVSISRSQRTPLPTLNYAANVYNGLDIKNFEFNEKPNANYLSFLARMSPEKGPVQAIKAAKIAGLKLKMAAKIDTVNVEFFNKKVKPLINNKQIKFIGEISRKEKSDFLKNSLCLLAPIQWEEPFGLFFIEAMACGTPVIAFERGSVTEIIKDKKTGFIVKPFNKDGKPNIEGLAKAIKKLSQMPKKEYQKMRQNCRRHIEKNFTAEKMVDGYEKVYYKILKSRE